LTARTDCRPRTTTAPRWWGPVLCHGDHWRTRRSVERQGSGDRRRCRTSIAHETTGKTMQDTSRKETRARTRHKTGTRTEWLTARLELLEAEKELTRRSDALARRRQDLPWVRIDTAYPFETDEGSAVLADLFRGRSQLLVYHFMFGPDYTAGCPACSAIAD